MICATVELRNRQQRRHVDIGGLWIKFEAKLAGRIVAKGKYSSFFVEGERVIVACGDLVNVKALQSRDFVALIIGACWPCSPGEARNTELSSSWKVFGA